MRTLQTRNFPVMGRGNLQSRIQFISEAPGAQEDIQGIPFVATFWSTL